ncbi:MAG: alcohol dehydrogenase catalytic domain-containing protein [Desulfobacterales bacterium]
MEAVVKTERTHGIEVLSIQDPDIEANDILVKIRCGSVCGSDVHVYEWTPGYEWMPLPIALGHEFSGEVVEIGGNVDSVNIGDRITSIPLMPCCRCAECRIGRGDICRQKIILGLGSHGAFAEYMRITAGADIFHIPENVSDEAASLCEPLAVSVNAVDRSGIKPGQTAAVLGPGPIGLLTLQVLKAAGAGLIIVAGTHSDGKRLSAAQKLGADVIVNVDSEDIEDVVRRHTGGAGLDCVFESSGNPISISQGIDMVRSFNPSSANESGGTVVLIGIHPSDARFSPTPFVRGRKSLVGAYGYSPETWKRSLALLATGKVDVEPMITHKLPFSRAVEGFELCLTKDAAKVLFVP